jgi:hypothetical protein
MKRRAGRQTSGEKQPPPRSRGVLAVSVWLLVLGVAFVLSVVLPFVGGSLLKVIVPWREIEQPLSLLLGLGFVLGAAGGWSGSLPAIQCRGRRAARKSTRASCWSPLGSAAQGSSRSGWPPDLALGSSVGRNPGLAFVPAAVFDLRPASARKLRAFQQSGPWLGFGRSGMRSSRRTCQLSARTWFTRLRKDRRGQSDVRERPSDPRGASARTGTRPSAGC